MANRYWVGGSGTWNTASTTNWSATSGGPGGASVPTAADSVFFDSATTYTVTLTGALFCLDFTISAGTVSFVAGTSPTITISGSMNITTPSVSFPNYPLTFNATTTGKTIRAPTDSTIYMQFIFNGVGGGWTLQNNLTTLNTVTLTAGTLSLGANTLTTQAFISNNSNTRVLAFGTGKIVCTSSGDIVQMHTMTGFSFTGTSRIEMNNSGSGTKNIFMGSVTGATSSNVMSLYVTAGTGTCTITAGSSIKSLDFTGFSGTWANTAITLYGSLTTSATMTVGSGVNTVTFAATTGTQSITTNGKILDFPITFNGAGGTWSLQDALSVGTSTARTVTLTAGTLELNSYTFTIFGLFSSSNSNTRRIQMSGSGGKIVLSGNTAITLWGSATITNMTTDSNILVQLTGGGATTKTINPGQLSEANAMSFQLSTTAGTVSFNTSDRVKNLTIDNNSFTVSNIQITIYGNLIVGGTTVTLTAGANAWTFAATSGTKTITTNGATLDFALTFNGIGGTWQLQENLVVGTATSRTVTLTNGTLNLNEFTFTIFGQFSSSNSNVRTIAFGTTGKIVLSATGAIATTLCTMTTETNLTVTGTNPLFQVTGSGVGPLTVTSTSTLINLQLSPVAAATIAVTGNVKNFTIDNSSNITLSNGTRSIYGNLTIGGTSPTLTGGTSATTFAATSGIKTITTNGEVIDFPITFNGVGGTWQLQDALTIGAGVTARQLTLTNGTLDLSAYTLTMFGNFSSSNSNIRTVNFGTGKIVLAMAGATTTTILDTSTSTNLTSIGSTPIEVVGAGTLTRTISTSTVGVVSATFNFSILTTAGIVANSGRYNNLTYNCTNTTVSGSPSLFGNLTMVTTVTSSSSGTTTMIGSSGTITSNGNTIVFPITIDTVGGTTTLNDALTLDITNSTNGALTLTNGTLNLNNFTATLNRFSSTNTNTRSIAFGTSGKILVRGTDDITNSAIYMDTMGGFSFSGTSNIEANITTAAVTQRIRMGLTSGATESNVMNFTLTGTLGTQQLLGSFKDITLNTDAIFTTNSTALCYGNFNHIKVSLTASTGSVTFASTSGTKTITSNGQTILYPIIFDGVGGTWQLQDALSVGNAASVTVTLTNGTLDLNSYTMTIFGIFSSSNSNTRRIQTTGSGGKIVLSLNTTATVWSTSTVTNMTTDGNILVQLTGGGAVVKTISAGALSEANSISFQLSNTAGTATFTASNTIKNLTIDNNSFTVSNIAFTIYGNLLIGGTTVTLTAGTNIWTFSATSGTKTITTNGATLVFPLTFNGVGGTWALQDALTMNSSRVITLTNGTFNLNNYTCTAAGGFTVTGSGSKVLAHGTGDLVISLAGATAFNGSDLGITDGSAAPVTITNNGTAVYDDATPFVGASNSILFNGTNQYLSVSANNAFLFDAGNFTIEAWIRPTSVATGPGISNTWQIGGAWHFSLSTSGYLKFFFTNAAAGVSTVGITGTTRQVTANSWNHVAVVRNGNTITLYVNGVADATTFNATGMTMYYYDGATKPLKIGVGPDTAGYFPGQISNFRIVKGTAVYTANFTPSTSPLTAVSGTSILVQQNHISAGTLTSTGTGKIDMTSATAKTFSGGNNSYATLNQGGAGTLTIRGTNTFQNITNSVQPATVLFTDGTTNTFTNDFDLNGTSGNLITIGSVTPASTFTLSKSSGTVDVSFCSISDSIATGGAAWYAGTTSTNGGNNTGWLFTAVVLASSSFLAFFFP